MMVRRIRGSERRKGSFSLIEVLVAVTLTAVLFGTTAMLTALLFRLERLGRDDLEETLATGRLAAELRSDVHASIEAEVEGDRLSLRAPGDRRVNYRLEDGALVRREAIPDGADRIEMYRFRPGRLVRWERPDGEDAGPIALIIESAERSDDPGMRRPPVRIEAVPGRDHRFAGGSR